MSIRNQAFAPHPKPAMRYRFARALATRINAPTFDQSPSFPACYQPGPDLTLMTETRTLVLIPARMAATRLPGKPLLDIAGLPMIVHVLRRAEAAQIGRVAVATDTPEIAAAVTSHGGEAVMTRADHPFGVGPDLRGARQARSRGPRPKSSSICRAIFRPSCPTTSAACSAPLADPAVDIATLAAEIHTEEESTNPNVVKAVGSPVERAAAARALLYPRHGPLGRRAALPSHRPLCLSPRGAGALCGAAPFRAGAAGKARAAPGDRGRHADRRHHRGHGAARRRYAGGSRNRAPDTGKSLSG